MEMTEGKRYEWNLTGTPQYGTFTGRYDNYKNCEGNLIMKNDVGVLWSINPKYIIKEVE